MWADSLFSHYTTVQIPGAARNSYVANFISFSKKSGSIIGKNDSVI